MDLYMLRDLIKNRDLFVRELKAKCFNFTIISSSTL